MRSRRRLRGLRAIRRVLAATVVIAAAATLATGASGAVSTARSWDETATSHRGQNGARFAYDCPALGTLSGRLWGTDVYTDDSSVCTAAVHAGLINVNEGGKVTIEIRPGQSAYQGSTRSGVTSGSWGAYSGSFVIVDAQPGPPAGVQAGGTGWTATATGYRGRNDVQYLFTCPPGGPPSRVWGTDVYTDDSSVCTAAVHAGFITVGAGGKATIVIGPGRSAYTGSTRNGIATRSYGSFAGSFTFVGKPEARDITRPLVQAQRSSGVVGQRVKLSFLVSDDSGVVRTRFSVYLGSQLVRRGAVSPWRNVGTTPNSWYWLWSTPRSLAPARYRWCVTAWDQAGNESLESCSTVRVSR